MLQRQLLERTLRVQCACGAIVAILLATTAAADDATPPRLDDSAFSFTEAADVVPMRIRAAVQRAGGEAVEGAFVITSAGGRGVTGASGVAVFEVDVPSDANELHVTAAMTNPQTGENLLGSTRVRDLRHAARDRNDEQRDIREVDVGPIVLHANAECQPQWLPTFGGHVGTSGSVLAFAVHDDGSGPALYVGGIFAYAGGILVNRIARWDGISWSPVGEGFAHHVPSATSVSALAVWDDGSGSGPALYAGGGFLTSGETEVNQIAKWDGSTWSPLGTGLNHSCRSLAVFDDGSGPALYAGGSFTQAGGVPVNRIAKWDGSVWSSVGSGVSGGGQHVLALQVHDDGSGPALYVGGSFTHAGGVLVNRIARWSGATWSPLAAGVSSIVGALSVFDDGNGPALYAGGAFTHAGDVLVNRVAKWDGTAWWALKTSTHTGVNGTVSVLSVFDDGSGATLVVGGNFNSPFSGLGRWTGSSWLPMGLGEGAQALATFDDGSGGGERLYVGGGFISAGSTAVNHIASWHGETSTWRPVGSGLNNRVYSLLVFDDGRGEALYAGGVFRYFNETPVLGVGKWIDSEATWSSTGDASGGMNRGFVAHDDGLGDGETLFVGHNPVRKWNPVTEEWIPLGSKFGGAGLYGNVGMVHALASFDDGTANGPSLFAGGYFKFVGDEEVNNVAKWDGTTWSDLAGGTNMGPSPPFGFNASVYALQVYDDGGGPALYVGGSFTHAGDVNVNRVAKWDGSKWSDLAGGVTSSSGAWVYALEVFDDGSGAGPMLVAAGAFGEVGGIEAIHIAMWDGESWSPLGSGMNGVVFALAAANDADGAPALYAGGNFTTAGGVAANKVAKWDGKSWSPLGDGVSEGRVDALTARYNDPDGGTMVYVGGDFLVSPGGDSYIAKWRHCPPPKPPLGDLNGDGLVGVADLLILLAAWGPCPDPANCPADLDGDGTVGVSDLLILLANWG